MSFHVINNLKIQNATMTIQLHTLKDFIKNQPIEEWDWEIRGPCWVIFPPRNWKRMSVIALPIQRPFFFLLVAITIKVCKLVFALIKRMMIWWRAISTQKWIILFLYFILFFLSNEMNAKCEMRVAMCNASFSFYFLK